MLRFLLVLLLLATPANAGMVIGSGAAPFCSSCTPGDPTDIMCDNLGGATETYTCTTWDGETENANSYLSWAAIDDDLTAVCSGMGSYALLLHMNDSDGSSEDAYNTISVTDSSTLYTQVYINILSTSLAAGAYISILQGRDGSTLLWFVRLINSSGNLRFQLVYRDSTDTLIYRMGTTNLSVDTAYRLGVKWVANTASPDGAVMYLDGSIEASANTSSDSMNINTLYIGSPAGQTAIGEDDDTEIQFKLLGVDNDTMPGACS